MVTGWSDSTKISLRLTNSTSKFIRHQNGVLKLSDITASSSTLDKQDATFTKTAGYSQPSLKVETKAPDHVNALLPAYLADPTIHKFGDTYYVYSTVTDLDTKDKKLVWSSPDLLNWTATPLVLNTTDYESSTGGTYNHSMLWAPSVTQGPDNKYYMYYTVYDSSTELSSSR